jgi:hypothetical protein
VLGFVQLKLDGKNPTKTKRTEGGKEMEGKQKEEKKTFPATFKYNPKPSPNHLFK